MKEKKLITLHRHIITALRDTDIAEEKILPLIDRYQAMGGDLNYCTPFVAEATVADDLDNYEIYFTLLGEAICENRCLVMEYLVGRGANPLLVDEKGTSPLLLAIEEGGETETIIRLAQLLAALNDIGPHTANTP